MVPEAAAEFLPVGALVQNCRIACRKKASSSPPLCVRSAVPVSNRSGHHFIRAGCEFIDLPGQRLTMISVSSPVSNGSARPAWPAWNSAGRRQEKGRKPAFFVCPTPPSDLDVHDVLVGGDQLLRTWTISWKETLWPVFGAIITSCRFWVVSPAAIFSAMPWACIWAR